MRSWSYLLVLGIVACTGDASKPDDTSDSDDTGDSVDTDQQGDTSATLAGKVVGPEGDLEGANIRFCRGPQCRYESTDAKGEFTFDKALVAWHSLEIVPPEGSGLATWFAAIELQKDQDRVVDVVIPALETTHALPDSSTELELGTGLFVTLGKDDIEPPLFVAPATHTGGVLVDEGALPPVDGVDPSKIVAAWYTTPFDHHATNAAGLPVRVKDQWSLTEGEVLDVWVGSYTESAWVGAGTLTVGADGWLTGDAALPLLSTVVLTSR